MTDAPVSAGPVGPARRTSGLWLLAGALLLYFLYRIADLVLVAFIAGLLSVYFSSLTDMLCRRLRIPRAPGLLLSLVATAAGLTGVALLLVPAVAQQVRGLAAAVPQYVTALDQWVSVLAASYPFLNDTGIASNQTGLVTTAIADLIEFTRSSLLAYASITGKVLIDGVAVIVMALYLAHRPRIYSAGIVQLTPPRHREAATAILRDLANTLKAWVGAQLLAMVVLAMLTGLGLWLLKVPYWLAFSIFSGIVVTVPFFGSMISTLLPALLVLPERGPLGFLAVASVGVIVHVVEANLVHPLIMEHRVALPPVLTIMSVLVMGNLGGLLGLLVAVPALTTVMVVVRHVLIYRTYGERPPDAEPPPAVLQQARISTAAPAVTEAGIVAPLLALLLLAAPAAAQVPAALDTARVDSLVLADLNARHLVGASIGVMRDGHTVLLRGYGQADIAAGRAVDTLTRFAIGSVTKQFTCAIILQLAAERRLSITDRVSKYFPTLTRAADVTLRDLMGHVSGYPDYYPLDFVDRRMLKAIRADSLIRWYGRLPLDFEPGTRWSYSNTGFIMLGRIAERVTGRPLERLLRERIFVPVGMRETTFEPQRRDDAYAQGYAAFALGDPEPAEPEAPGWAAAAGGIWSTPRDLLLWDRALMEGRVVAPAQWSQMTTPRLLANGAGTGYGFGLAIGRLGADTALSHGGAVSGFNAQNLMVPATRSALVVLVNSEGGINFGALARTVLPYHPVPPADSARRPVAPLPSADPRPVPVIAGPPATEQAALLLRQLQAGRVDRAALGDEFSWWLTDARVRGASARLSPLGEPTRSQERQRAERGGLEVTVTRFTFAGGRTLSALMYRAPNGKVEEYLISEP